MEEDISWDVYQRFRQSTPAWLKIWATKYSANLLPTRANLVLRGHSDSHSCPCCGAPNETADHLLQCQDTEMKKTFQDAIDAVSDFLYDSTSTDIRNSIISIIEHFQSDDIFECTTPEMQGIEEKQIQLGSQTTLNGIWQTGWIEVKSQYLRRISSRASPKVWLTLLSLKIQRLTHQLWLTRNEAIYSREDSVLQNEKHANLDQAITDIFQSLPNLRLLPPCDAAFFKRDEDRVKKYRLRKKEQWVADAHRVRDAFWDSLDPMAESFLDYFGTTT